MREKVVEQEIELGGCELAVLFPPHSLFGLLVANHEFVLGRSAGVDSSLGAKRAAVHDEAFAIGNCMFVERRLGKVPMDARQTFETKFFGAMSAVPQSCFLHEQTS